MHKHLKYKVLKSSPAFWRLESKFKLNKSSQLRKSRSLCKKNRKIRDEQIELEAKYRVFKLGNACQNRKRQPFN